MELSQEEKDHIIAEEKLRMETRKEFLKENFGHGGYGWRGGWHSYGCHRRCGGGLFKILAVVAIIFAACHFWHHSYCGGAPYYYGYGAPAYQAPQAPTAPPVSK